jgi:PIN domain nuclease of toxin-antitoxin system
MPKLAASLSTDLLLDTHIALWLDSGANRLRGSTLALIEGCWRDGGHILISAVTAWEIAQLAFLGRITLDLPADAWFARLVTHPGVRPVPLEPVAGSRAYLPATL